MKIKGVKPTKIFRGDQLPDIDIDFPADFRDAVKDRIKEKYGYELNEISNKLNQLEAGRVYENGGSKMDGSLATNIKQLRKMIGELLLKIQNGKDGTDDEIAKLFINKEY